MEAVVPLVLLALKRLDAIALNPVRSPVVVATFEIEKVAGVKLFQTLDGSLAGAAPVDVTAPASPKSMRAVEARREAGVSSHGSGKHTVANRLKASPGRRLVATRSDAPRRRPRSRPDSDEREQRPSPTFSARPPRGRTPR